MEREMKDKGWTWGHVERQAADRKPVAISGKDRMCTYARRGLKKDRVETFSLPSLFDLTLAFRLPIIMRKSRFGTLSTVVCRDD